MDNQLNPATGDYNGQTCTDLSNATYLRLRTPLGSYLFAPTLGSRLHELSREKDVTRAINLALDYARQALTPLRADGRARTIQIAYTRPKHGTLVLHIDITAASGNILQLAHPVQVG